MAERPAALLSVGFLLLLLTREGMTNTGPISIPIRLTVENDLFNMAPESFSSSVAEGGVLLGALRRLQEAQPDFKFTVKDHPDFGVFLQSVNGVAGDEHKQTYWEILSENSGEYTRLDVGIGCYAPKADEHIILRFSTWSSRKQE
uniref:Uncharacterized protein n=1 Tax=Cyprinodon variegatus TaxID=28743 RepID=A0A3Q2CXG8_CYPVA